jgi:hypothetical protein
VLCETMATTLEVATREIFVLLKAAWDANAAAVVGGSPLPTLPFLFEDINWNGRPTTDIQTAWARVTIRHSNGEQSTLADRTGKARFTNYGIVLIQVFAPMRDNTGAMVSRRLASVVKAALQGKATANVWFRQATYMDVGREGTWYQFNVSANFEWDEVTQ